MEGYDMTFSPKAWVLASVIALTSSQGFAATHGSSTTIPSQHLAASALLGTWSLDTSRMAMPPEQRPKNVRFTFGDAGDNKLAMQVDITYAPGNEVHSAGTSALDGTPSAVKNSPEADTASFKLPAPNVLIMALQRKGVLVSTRIYSVMPDGHSLTETAVYPGENGSIIMKTNYFTRVR
jgi:hypothetical protein